MQYSGVSELTLEPALRGDEPSRLLLYGDRQLDVLADAVPAKRSLYGHSLITFAFLGLSGAGSGLLV